MARLSRVISKNKGDEKRGGEEEKADLVSRKNKRERERKRGAR